MVTSEFDKITANLGKTYAHKGFNFVQLEKTREEIKLAVKYKECFFWCTESHVYLDINDQKFITDNVTFDAIFYWECIQYHCMTLDRP